MELYTAVAVHHLHMSAVTSSPQSCIARPVVWPAGKGSDTMPMRSSCRPPGTGVVVNAYPQLPVLHKQIIEAMRYYSQMKSMARSKKISKRSVDAAMYLTPGVDGLPLPCAQVGFGNCLCSTCNCGQAKHGMKVYVYHTPQFQEALHKP